MELAIEPLGDSITKVVLTGRWDVAGAAQIDLGLSALAGSGRSLILDMTGVGFLSSMGLRSIVMGVKAAALRQAKLVLLSPGENVAMVLTGTGIDRLAPIYRDIDAALAAIAAG
jgi:anti-anti-sigma factor